MIFRRIDLRITTKLAASITEYEDRALENDLVTYVEDHFFLNPWWPINGSWFGVGFDWSYMAEDEAPTNMALMALSDSELNKFEFHLATYKRGLASVEEQLVFYKKNEVIFGDQLAVLKRDISFKNSEISVLNSELEKLKQDKESNQLKIENFDNASKYLDKIIGRIFSPLKPDLSYSSLEEFQQPKFEGYGPKSSENVSDNIFNEIRENINAPLVEELVSDDKLEKKTVSLTISKIEFVRPKQQEKLVRKPVKYAEMYSFDHVQAACNYHQRERMVTGKNYTRVNYNYTAQKAHPSSHRNMVPRAVLMKTGLRPLNTIRPINTAHPKTIVYSARPKSFNTAKGKFYTANSKAVNTATPNSAVVNAVRENLDNAIKASAYWGHPQNEDQGYVDSGCLRHMTGNMSYLTDFKEFDGGYVAFGGGAKGGRIKGKGTLKTGKLDFEDA
ncbi:hypothetical protein Tco_0903705, partial [Tanacetum coccineum]